MPPAPPGPSNRGMPNAERAAQEWTLAEAPKGWPVEVIDVGAREPALLLVHGVRRGARVLVDGDAPFGGPRIVRVGGARVAIDRRLAGEIRVAETTVS